MFGLPLPTRVDGGKGHKFKTHLLPYLTNYLFIFYFKKGIFFGRKRERGKGGCRLEGSIGRIGGWWVEFNVLTFPLHGIK